MTRLSLLFIWLIAGTALAEELRVWTDVSGRQLEAEFLGVERDSVKIKRATDNRVFLLPIARLSEEDQAYIKAQSKTKEPTATVTKFDGLEWPRRVGLPDDYDVEVVKEDSSTGEYIYRTPNFEFHSDVKLARKVVREFGKIFEGTYAAMQVFPLNWTPQPGESHFKTQLFESKEEYYEAGGLPNSGGIYRSDTREIWTPLASLGVKKSSSSYTLDDSNNYSTLIHEITHQVHHDWLRRLPPWMIEGMAVYMESVPYDDGEFRFDRRELEEFVVSQSRMPGHVAMVPLNRLMTMSHQEWNEQFHSNPDELGTYYLSAFLLINYFLYFDGEGEGRRLFAYCRAIEGGDTFEQAQSLLLDGRDFAELTEDVRSAYKREKIDLMEM